MPSARRIGTNENIQTYGAPGFGRDFTSLTTWESLTDNDLVGGALSEILECYFDTSIFTDSVYAAGDTSNTIFFRIIRPAPGQGHDGTPNTGVRFTDAVIGGTFYLDNANFQVQDIIATNTLSNSVLTGAFYLSVADKSAAVGCIAIDCVNGGSSTGNGFVADVVDTRDVSFIDCLAIDCEDAGFSLSADLGTTSLYNCTSVGNAVGFERTGGTVVAKNCLSDNITTDFTGTFDAASEFNASSDATAPGTDSRISQTFTFINAAVNDYHLDPTDTGALDFGLQLKEDSIFPFNDDLDGHSIHFWSIGADSTRPLSSRRVGKNENIQTYGGIGRDFTALPTWEALTDIDLVAAEVTEVLECHDDAVFDDGIVMATTVTNDKFFRVVRAATSQGHDGTPNTGVRFAATSGSRVFQIGERNASIQDIVASIVVNSAGNIFGLSFSSGGSGDAVGCIFHDIVNAGAGGGIGVVMSGSTVQGSEVINCAAINCDNEGFRLNQAGVEGVFINCTSRGNLTGFSRGAGNMSLVNCLADNNTTDFSGTMVRTFNNASSDASAPGADSRIDQTFTFVNTATSDLHLTSGDLGALDFGKDVTSNPDFSLTDDIDRLPVVLPFSIGFDSRNAILPAIPLTPVTSKKLVPGRVYRYVFSIPTVLASSASGLFLLPLSRSTGKIQHVRVSYPGSTDISLSLGVLDGSFSNTYQEVFAKTGITSISRDDKIQVRFANDDSPPAQVPRGFTGTAAVYAEVTNTGANATGAIVLELAIES